MCLVSKSKATINDLIYGMSAAMQLIVILTGIPEVLNTFSAFWSGKMKPNSQKHMYLIHEI